MQIAATGTKLDDYLSKVTGTVDYFDAHKGYGMVKIDGQENSALLHITTLRSRNLQAPEKGARIHCVVLKRTKGLQVFSIEAIESPKVAA